VIYTSNEEIYGREYGNGKCYMCLACDAYVGVHTGSRVPLGRLADRELRELKKKCHRLFDTAWRGRQLSRERAYRHLAERIGIPPTECHFGWFGKDLLIKSLDILQYPAWYKKNDMPSRSRNGSVSLSNAESAYGGKAQSYRAERA
jgi:hypothetical protein